MECTGTYSECTHEDPNLCSCGPCLNYPTCSHYGGAFYNPLPPWERQWTENRQDKPRRIVLIRSVWHLPYDSEMAYQIHTIWHGQRSVAYAAAVNRNRNNPRRTGRGTTQESLSLLD